MAPFKFIHAADLHIGSPFKGVSAQSGVIAQQLRDATIKSYQNIVDLAISSGCAFVVLAGDIYDAAERNLYAQLAFVEGLNKLSERGISVFIAHGNHDPLSGWNSAIELPKGCLVFSDSPSGQVVRGPDGRALAFIAGISYPSAQEDRNLARQLAKVDLSGARQLFKIAVLHCNVGADTGHANYAPCSVSDLTSARFDYWALGHVHERKVLSERPWVGYPGNSQGRSIRETGARGCYLVSVNGAGKAKAEFKATDVIRFDKEAVSIEALNSVNELEAHLLQAVDRMSGRADGRPLIARLTLSGRGLLHHQLCKDNQVAELLQHLRARVQSDEPFRWIEQIELRCLPPVNLDEIAERDDLPALVMREARSMSGAQLQEAAGSLFGALYNNGAAKLINPPSQAQLQELLDEAAMLCFDKLENS